MAERIMDLIKLSEKDVFQSLKILLSPILNIIVDIKHEGVENIPPKGGRIIIGNHRSDMDPFIVASVVPYYISWIAAEYTKKIPVFDALIQNTGVIPMDINGNISISSIKRVMTVLRKGEVLGIFPEGHDYMVQNDFSAPMVRFHDGFAVFAYKARVPIIPFVIIPIEEEITSIPLPPAIRQMMGLPEEIVRLPLRTQYKKVKVVFSKPIMPEEFLHQEEEKAIPYIVDRSREIMENIQRKEGMLAS
ncbi:MAG: 1-acyl-sn-glycerol-3-phosphate acyltransferase [Leptospiraceae bacterium]|nr:1-acyl-sn-glycerol-3-phosphate acyltransferase [Leptospiraceae bacterium]MDW7974991.1 lysophospholipid acyltransferase family protein [Leptospiraceae bacterium]